MRAMERRGRRGEDGREEEGREGKGERRDRRGRTVEGNRDQGWKNPRFFKKIFRFLGF